MEMIDFARFVGAFAIVLGLIGAAAFCARRFGLTARLGTSPSRERRLGIIDSLTLDPRRRLILVRRDDKEHLILLGQSGETLVESHDGGLAQESFAGVSVYSGHSYHPVSDPAYGQA